MWTRPLYIGLIVCAAALVNLRGDEHERLSALRGKMREADAAIRDARIESESSASQAAALLGVAAPTPDVLQGLHESLAVLQRCERDVAQYERELAEGTGRQADARRALGGSALVSDDQLSRIDAVTFGELSEFAREVERARAQADAARQQSQRRRGLGEPSRPHSLRQRGSARSIHLRVERRLR